MRTNACEVVNRPWDFDYVGATNEELFKRFNTSQKGLSHEEVTKRLKLFGHNEIAIKKKRHIIIEFLSKFMNPLEVVLLVIAAISLFFGQNINALFITAMAVISVCLSFAQEYRAGKAAEKLHNMVRTNVAVWRGGKLHEVHLRSVVPGDIVELSAGDMIPADLRIISAKDLFVDQSSLTGESFPAEKFAKPLATTSRSISDLTNIAFMGSSVVSGTAMGIVIKTAAHTEFGELSCRVSEVKSETNFDKGIKSFTWMMIRFMIILAVIVFVINIIFKGNFIEALLFSLAVAVGLTPEMLPMLVTVNLSKGALAMSKKKVIVKHIDSIQNFGAMDVLCTDKTGTLTMNEIVLEKHCDVMGKDDEDVLRYGYLNSFYQTGLKSLLDKAILRHEKMLMRQFKKIDEIPFDFERKMMSVVVEDGGKRILITKGAPETVLSRCKSYELGGKTAVVTPKLLKGFKALYESFEKDGFRVLAVAYTNVPNKSAYDLVDETGFVLKGFMAFLDPPKPTAKKAIDALKKRGIDTVILTGDSELVTKKICSEVGLDVKTIIIGEKIAEANDTELQEIVKTTTIFARLDPMQKERIVRALQRNGRVVGYLGDGINDAPALRAADVGISVNNAVDVAKESASLILLEKNLSVLDDGVVEGRKTFGNILKYIKMSSSSNFGNMFSMIGASIFLPFVPMQPVQILFNNFLYDMSQTAIPTDNVDPEYIMQPRPWNIRYLRKFMVIIGPLSSIYDYLTYFVMWFVFSANNIGSQALFNTGWFTESLCSQTLVIYIIRTGKIPFIQSWPSKFLMATTLTIVAIGIIVPLSPLGAYFGFVPLPLLFYVILAGMLVTYLLLVQVVKSWFIKKYGYE